MRKVRQLKESLLGWGGYKDVQDKIYLNKNVVYMRGNIQTITTEVSERFYKWESTITENNTTNTIYYYTKDRNPKLGDYAFTDYDSSNRNYDGYVYSNNDTTLVLYRKNTGKQTCTFVEQLDSPMTFTISGEREKVYLVNFDHTQTSKTFNIDISYEDTRLNEKFFFDKQTQCLIRTAYQQVGPVYTSTIPVMKKMVFDSFDPNTGELLDHHIVWGVSSHDLGQGSRKENISNGLYSFYCNGAGGYSHNNPWDSGIVHPATVFVYTPRFKRVCKFEVGNVLDVRNPLPTTPAALTNSVLKDAFIGIYNQSEDLDDLTDLQIGMYVPDYLTDSAGNINQKFYVVHANAELNGDNVYVPFTVDMTAVGTASCSLYGIATDLDSNNYYKTNNMKFDYIESSFLNFGLKLNQDFFVDGREITLLEPVASNTPGVILKLTYQEQNNRVYFKREYKDGTGSDLVSPISGYITGLQPDTFYLFAWFKAGSTEYLACSKDNGFYYNPCVQGAALPDYLENVSQPYKIGPEYCKLYLTKTNLSITEYTDLTRTYTQITSDYAPRARARVSANTNTFKYLAHSISTGAGGNSLITIMGTTGTENATTLTGWEQYATIQLNSVITSSDDIYWVSGNHFVFITSTGECYKSIDGITWTSVELPTYSSPQTWIGLEYDKGVYYAAYSVFSHRIYIYTTTDLETWTQDSTTTYEVLNQNTILKKFYYFNDYRYGYWWNYDGSSNYDYTIKTKNTNDTAFPKHSVWCGNGNSFSSDHLITLFPDCYFDRLNAIWNDSGVGKLYHGRCSNLLQNNTSYSFDLVGQFMDGRTTSYNNSSYAENKKTIFLNNINSYFVRGDVTKNTSTTGTQIEQNGATQDVFVLNENVSSGSLIANSYNLYPMTPFTQDFSFFANSDAIYNKGVYYTDYYIWSNTDYDTSDVYTRYHLMSLPSAFIQLYALGAFPTTGLLTDSNVTYFYGLTSSAWSGNINYAMSFISQYDTRSPQYGSYGFGKQSYNGTDFSTPYSSYAYFPKLFSGPRYFAKPKLIEEAGSLGTIDGADVYKTYNDPCYAMIVFGNQTNGGRWYAVGIISDTVAGATITDNGTEKINGRMIYRGRTYYYSYKYAYAGTNAWPTATNPKDLPVQYIQNLGSIGQREIIRCVIGNTAENISAFVPTFVFDRYNNGNTISKYLRRIVAEYPIYGNSITNLNIKCAAYEQDWHYAYSPEQLYIPQTEKYMILTYNEDYSNAKARYFSLLQTNVKYFDLESGEEPGYFIDNTFYLDANTNTEYLADNTLGSASVCQSGGFAIPPVAIADGELKQDDDELPETYYAWKKTTDNTIIFTDSLDADEVIEKPYFFKDDYNNFYREALSNNTEITSLTATYVTTRSGAEYTRIDGYDWSLQHSDQTYVPSHLRGWSY